jgi:hypothetical protein
MLPAAKATSMSHESFQQMASTMVCSFTARRVSRAESPPPTVAMYMSQFCGVVEFVVVENGNGEGQFCSVSIKLWNTIRVLQKGKP